MDFRQTVSHAGQQSSRLLRLGIIFFAVLCFVACHSEPAWVTTIERDGDLIEKRYDCRHFLANSFFDLNMALSSTNSGGSVEAQKVDQLIDEVRAIQSMKVYSIVIHYTASVPPGLKTKQDYIEQVRYLPIVEISPGVYTMTGTPAEHEQVLEVLHSLEPRFHDDPLDIDPDITLGAGR